MKESETKERLEEYAPLGVLAPVVQKLDSAIYLFNNWDLVISRDLIPPVCPSQIKKRSVQNITLPECNCGTLSLSGKQFSTLLVTCPHDFDRRKR